jgi:DNA-binding transcriptional LysR family regulator
MVLIEVPWEQMPYFLAVARKGTLRGAAEQLNANHGTVDRHIRALEATYGTQLFSRTRKGLSLTEAGRALLPTIEDAEKLLAEGQKQLRGLDRDETGTVRVSMPATLACIVIAPILARFSDSYPGINLEIQLTERFEDIAQLATDVSIRVAYEVDDNDVVGRRLFPLVVGTYASKDYLSRHLRNSGPLGEKLHWIGWGQPSSFSKWIAQSPFPNAESRHAVADMLMQMHLVQSGFGMSVLPVFCEAQFPDLVRVPGTELLPDRSIWLLLHSDLRRTIRVRRFVDFVTDALKSQKQFLQGEPIVSQ